MLLPQFQIENCWARQAFTSLPPQLSSSLRPQPRFPAKIFLLTVPFTLSSYPAKVKIDG
jgi:hypothetical protein